MYGKAWLKPELIQFIAAIAALLFGLMTYLLIRDPQQVYFLSHFSHFQQSDSSKPGIISDFLPSLFHTYAFILLTAAILSASTAQSRSVCLFWFFLECSFEIGQHRAIAAHLSEYLGNIRFPEVFGEYFVNGTFDLLDIAAIAIGASLAYATVSISFSVVPFNSNSKFQGHIT